MDNELKRTEEEFKNFSPQLKDDLCDTYEYAIKHLGTQITKDNIRLAQGAISIVGTPSEKWCNIFMANLDQIERLVEERPTHLINYTLHRPIHHYNGEPQNFEVVNDHFYVVPQMEIFRSYDQKRINNRQILICSQQFYYSHEITTKTEL